MGRSACVGAFALLAPMGAATVDASVMVTSSFREVYVFEDPVELQDTTAALGPWTAFEQLVAVEAFQDTTVTEGPFQVYGEGGAVIHPAAPVERVGRSQVDIDFEVIGESQEFIWSITWMFAYADPFMAANGWYELRNETADVVLISIRVDGDPFTPEPDGVGPEGGFITLDPALYSIRFGVQVTGVSGGAADAGFYAGFGEWPTPGTAGLLGIAAMALCVRRRG